MPDDCAVIYARYSSHAQRDVSIENQVADCRIYAERLGLTVLEVYADHATTGRSDDRHQFQRMIQDAKKGKWKTVLTWKTDRFARNRYDSAVYKARLKRYDVRVQYAKESIPDGPEGILMEGMLESYAEYFSANLAQNVRRGLNSNAQKCKLNGPAPLGYRRGSDGGYEIVESEAAVVRRIYQSIAQGTGYAELVRELNAAGIKTKRGGSWTKNSFHKILRNEAYIGVYQYGEHRTEDAIPPIITKEEFAAVQDKLATYKKHNAHTGDIREYLLTGKLFCGNCGEGMVGICGTSKSGVRHYYYMCKGHQAHRCEMKNVKAEKLEDQVVSYTMQYVLQDDVIAELVDKLLEYQAQQQDSGMLEALRAELADVQGRLDNLMEAIEAGIITKTTKARLSELEAEQERLTHSITVETCRNTGLSREQLIFLFDMFRAGDMRDLDFRRRLIDTFVNAVFVYDDGRLKIVYNFREGNETVTKEFVDSVESGAVDSVRMMVNSVYHGHPKGCPFSFFFPNRCKIWSAKKSKKSENFA